MTDYLTSLDENQKAAVLATDARVLVSACPGSGKTRTIVARYHHLITALSVHPSNIVLLTFTRHAAGEMMDRIGDRNRRGTIISTFHSFCLRMILTYGRHTGWSPEWLTVVDEIESELEERAVLKRAGVISQRGTWVVPQKDWLAYKQAPVRGQNIRFDEAHDALRALLKAENVLTYDTLVTECAAVLEVPEVLADVQKRYQYILVDEAQDSDSDQWAMIEKLAPLSLYVVGDLDQSIYGWRGGRPDLFLAYSKTAKCYTLPVSYRFGFNLATIANRLITHNTERIDMLIETIKAGGLVRRSMNTVDVGLLVKDILADGFLPQDIAILGRTHAVLERAVADCGAHQIPVNYSAAEKGRLKRMPEWRAVLGFLHLMVNPGDTRGFQSVAAISGLTDESVFEARRKAIQDRQGLATAAGIRIPADLYDLRQTVVPMVSDDNRGFIDAVLGSLIVGKAIDSAQELLNWLALADQQDDISDGQRVTVTTIHGAKGLQWPAVVLVGLNSRDFPSRKAITEGRIEEERRLAYVAMTRAENALYLVNHAAQSVSDMPSMFLGEMGETEALRSADQDDDLSY